MVLCLLAPIRLNGIYDYALDGAIFEGLLRLTSRYIDSLRAGRSRDLILVGRDIPRPSILALGFTQPPIPRVPALFPGDKEAGVWC